MRVFPAISVLALALGTPPSPAVAQVNVSTGNMLYDMCSASTDIQLKGCIEFLDGTIGAVAAMASRDKSAPPFCIPRTASYEQLADMVVKIMKDDPAIRSRPAVVVVFVTFHKAFPC